MHTKKKEPFIHIVKRADLPGWKAWLIRGIAVLAAFLVSGLVCLILTKGKYFGSFYVEMFDGAFGTERRILNLFQYWAMLLCVSLAVTPAFKMKFWNIGAEGQTLMGSFASAIVIWYLGGKIPEGALIVLMLAASIIAGAIWAVIPAIFKAFFNTNETLFTLMMNYLASHLVLFTIDQWVTNGSRVVGILNHGSFANAFGKLYVVNAVIVTVLTALTYVYLRFSKHGYELEVVGESVNTAKYIGINVKKVIIRTMILSGVLCGIGGFLLVGGSNTPTINGSLVDGRGFTAILVSWLAQFNPIIMAFVAFLVIFMQRGSAQAASKFQIAGADAFNGVIVGIFFLLVIASEFFVRYKVILKTKKIKRKEAMAKEGVK